MLKVPIDVFLGHDPNGYPNQKRNQSVFIKNLEERLEYAYKLSREKNQRSTAHQKKGYDTRLRPTCVIRTGDRVLVRNLVPSGKLDDYWEEKVYVVQSKPNGDIPVYCVRPESGGRQRVLHRNHLLPLPEEGLHAAVDENSNNVTENTVSAKRPSRTRRRPARLNSGEWVF